MAVIRSQVNIEYRESIFFEIFENFRTITVIFFLAKKVKFEVQKRQFSAKSANKGT